MSFFSSQGWEYKEAGIWINVQIHVPFKIPQIIYLKRWRRKYSPYFRVKPNTAN